MAPFLVLAHGIYIALFEKNSLKKWMISIGFMVVSFIPWIPQFIKQLNIGTGLVSALPGWGDAVSTPIVKILPLIFVKFIIGRITFDNKLVYGSISAILFTIFTYLTIKGCKKNIKMAKQLLVLLIVPIISAFLVSIFLPILAPQRVLYVLPIFYLLISLGLNSIDNKQVKIGIIGIFLVISSYSNYQCVTNVRFQREQWRQAVKFVESQGNSKSIAVFIFPEAFAPWKYYSRKIVPSIGVASKFVVNQQDLKQSFDRINKSDKVFLFHYLEDLTEPEKQVSKYLIDLGFIEIKKTDFPGVGFISIYEKYIAYN